MSRESGWVGESGWVEGVRMSRGVRMGRVNQDGWGKSGWVR